MFAQFLTVYYSGKDKCLQALADEAVAKFLLCLKPRQLVWSKNQLFACEVERS